jgi:hypothetical protein
VTDALDQLAPAARPLLHRVDTALVETGAAADDPVWPLLRRVRASPSDAVATMAGWQPAPLAAVADPLRALARRYGEALDGLPARPPWEGAGAVAYGVQWSVLRGHVTGAGPDSMVGRLRESAAYADELADWVRRSRRAVAVALADVLASAEAVTLVTALVTTTFPGGVAGVPGVAGGPAAARIAAHVLEPVAAACDEGRRLHDEWRAKLGEVPLSRPPAGALPDTGPTDVPVVRISD